MATRGVRWRACEGTGDEAMTKTYARDFVNTIFLGEDMESARDEINFRCDDRPFDETQHGGVRSYKALAAFLRELSEALQ